MGSSFKDITGIKKNKLTPLKRTGERGVSGDFMWECLCDCGNKVEVAIGRIQSGSAYSCGCETRRGKHRMTDTPTYRSWIKLCSRTRSEAYAEWHGDVEVCDRWDTTKGGSFANFLEDMGERPEGKTINRINGAKIYSKETCEWATLSVQSFDQKRPNSNTSGKTGVRFREDRGTWVAIINYQNKKIHLGTYQTFEEAVKVREEAELKYYGFTKE